MSKKILSLFPLFLLLAACAAQPTPLSPTVTIQAADTKPPLLTATPQPTATGTATATPKPTLTHTPTTTQTHTPTIDATTTAIIVELVSTVQPRQKSFVSPDQQWKVQILSYDCTKIVEEEWYESAYELMQLVHLSDGNTRTITDQLTFCGGIGTSGLGGMSWSPNSRYFYFSAEAYGVPDGSQLGWQRSILRYDTITTDIEGVGGPLSPDQQKIAGVQYQKEKWCLPQALVVQTLNGDILASYPTTSEQEDCYPGYGMTAPDYSWRAYIAWAEDSNSVAYLEIPCDRSGCKSTLYSIDLIKNERQVLFDSHQPAFFEVAWSQPNLLILTDQDYKTWFYTLSTGKLEQQVK